MSKISFDKLQDFISFTDKSEPESINLQRKRIKLIIRRVIAEQLSERQRELCLLYFYDNMDMPTIAKTLNINKSTVSRTIARALKNISDKVEYVGTTRQRISAGDTNKQFPSE